MSDLEYTGDDLDAIRAVRNDRGYQLIEQRIQATAAVLRAELERDLEPGQTAKVRGQIAGLTTALNIPGILADEIGDDIKEQEHGG